MIEKNIMIVDDDKDLLKLLSDFLKCNGYTVLTASNGKEAIDIFSVNPCPLVITDINMPQMDGVSLVSNLNAFEFKPIIIILSGNEDIDVVVNVMKQGVQDYLKKPVNFNELLVKVHKSYELYEMKRNMALIEREKIIKLERQVEFLQWRERVMSNEMKVDEKNFIENMYRSFNQGSGFGYLVTVGELILDSVKIDNDVATIDSYLIDIFKKNLETSKKGLSELSKIIEITANDIELKKSNLMDIYESIVSIKNGMTKFLSVKNQTILLNEYNENIECITNINIDFFKEVVYELLINAMKFSKKNSKIIILVGKQENELVINFINEPQISANNEGGIPFGYENLIFEPFFRVIKFVQEEYNTLEFGLGLSKVEIIVKKLNGKINAFIINDYSDEEKTLIKKIAFKLSLPIVK